jgi:multidrug efflux pump
MCGRLLRVDATPSVRARVTGVTSECMLGWYKALLGRVVRARTGMLILGLGVSMGSLVLLKHLPSELAPLEDVGWFSGFLSAPQGATIRYTDTYARELESLIAAVPEVESTYTVVARGFSPTIVNRAVSWVTLRDWSDRTRSQQEVVAALNRDLGRLTGVKAFLMNPSSIEEWSDKTPVQFVIGGAEYQELQQAAERLIKKLAEHPGFISPDMDLALNTPHVTVEAHRDKAADLGVSVAAIGRTLETMLSGRPVNTFTVNGRQYKVIVKVDDRRREKPSDISELYVRGKEGELAQLGNMIRVREEPVPESLNHVDRMRAITISAGLADGFTLGQALAYLDGAAKDVLLSSMRTSYAGESKTFMESKTNLYVTFALALLVVYLVLSAQFESFRHPFTILLAVPPAVSGALLSLAATGGSLSIYSQIGMIILIGLVTKNAILMVEFANQLRVRGLQATEAVIEAATMRLRPILMTTTATILGALPLAIATGAGAVARRQIGMVLIGGLVISTIVTLFLVPAAYTIFSRVEKAKAQLD